MSAVDMQKFAESFDRDKAIEYLANGEIVILSAGTGNPYFSTDTAAALRAMEIRAKVLLKATKVDGIYSGDPFEEKKVKKLPEITYREYLRRGLKVMDATAVSLCMEHVLPIIVFDLKRKGNIKRVVIGQEIGSRIGA